MKTSTLFTSLIVIVLGVTVAVTSGRPDSASDDVPGGSFAVVGVRVFDGREVMPEATVVVDNGVIVAVGPDVAPADGRPVVDGRGATLLPGLIDAHTHSWATALERAVVFGVTTQVDMFTDVEWARTMRREQAEGRALGRADLVSAGTLATAPGGHGTQYGLSIPTISEVSQAAAFVEARLAEGSDFIKIVSEDGSGFGHDLPTLDRATIAALIEAARAQGVLAVVHATERSRARSAIEDGADGLVHLFADSAPGSDFAALVAERGAFVIPTLTVVESTVGVASGASLIDDEDLGPYLTGEERAGLGQSFPANEGTIDIALATVHQLHAAGVPILAGSDAPNPGTGHGASLHRELELLVDAGLTPAAALAAATSVPAAVFSLADRGRIAPGLRADLVLVQGDPTTDIMASRRIRQVWKAGHVVARPLAATGAAAPAAAVPASGLVSDFEDGRLTASFGAGWSTSTDSMMGGSSTVEVSVVDGGGNGSGHAMAVNGTVRTGSAFPWSGAMFFPGESPMAAVDLSSYRGISFVARADGDAVADGFRIMLFAASLGVRPAERRFTAGPEWREQQLVFADFNVDGSDVTGIFFGSGPAAGVFRLLVDDFRLVPVD